MPLLAGREVGQNGLGLMRLTWHGGALTDKQAFKVLKSALAAGVRVWNGADFYGTPDHNSLHMLARYFDTYPEDADRVIISIKSGVLDMKTFTMDASPSFMRASVENANKILNGMKKIDFFGPGRVDPKVSIEETVKCLDELVEEGAIGGIQLSEVKADTIRRAAHVATIGLVEAEISLWSTEVFDNGVAATCNELDIPMVAHTPLGAGMLTGRVKSLDDMSPNDYHRFFPRFSVENFPKNLDLVAQIEKLAKARGCTPTQLALCWIKSQSKKPTMPVIFPVPGSSSGDRIFENAQEVELTDEDLQEIEAVLTSCTVAGSRNPPAAAELTEY